MTAPTADELKEQLTFQTSKADTLEQELVKAKIQIDKLNADLQSQSKGKSEASNKTVFIAREKKIAKLCGRPISLNDPEVNEWIQDAKQHLKTIDPIDAKLDFIYDNIGGQCKDEIRLRPESERNTPENIFEIIRTVFTDCHTIASLQQKFYQRNQEIGETLQNYSLALMKIVDKIENKDAKAITDKDTMLKEKFVDGIRDDSLRREMRRYLNQYKTMKFPQFRETVMDWAEDYRIRGIQVKTEGVTVKQEKSMMDTLQEMKTMMENQKLQIDAQAKEIHTLMEKVNMTKPAYRRQQDDEGSMHVNVTKRGQGNVKNAYITCYKCGGKGHKANKCPSEMDPREDNSRSGKQEKGE